MPNWNELYRNGDLPTVAKLHALPLWARVAFATRCARLAQPRLSELWPTMPEEHRRAVEASIAAGETHTAHELPLRELTSASSDAYNAANSLRDRDNLQETGPLASKVQGAIGAANYTAYAALSAVMGQGSPATENAVDAGREAYQALPEALRPKIREAYESLLAAAESRAWDHRTTEPVDFFKSGTTTVAEDALATVGTRLLPLRDLIALGKWPNADCVKDRPTIEADEYFFVSHRWLSPKHPDPDGRKWRQLETWWNALEALKEEISGIDPANFDHRQRQALASKRFAVAPLLTRQDNDDFNNWASGMLPVKPHWLDADKTPAAVEFLAWLTGTVDRVLDSHLWIDSYATANRQHRETCAECQAIHHQTMLSIPELVEDSVCLRLGGFAADEDERGWLILEGSIAQLHQVLMGDRAAWSWDPAEGMDRIHRLDFRCADPTDGVTIPKLFALGHAAAQLRQSFNPRYHKDPQADRKFLRLLRSAALQGDSRDPVGEIATFLRRLRSPTVLERLPLLGNHAGAFLTYCATWVLRGILGSAARRQGYAIPDGQQQLTTLQACLYLFVCRARFNSHDAARAIVECWQAKTGARIVVDLASTRIPHEIDREIDRLVDFWLAGDNTFDILPQEFEEG